MTAPLPDPLALRAEPSEQLKIRLTRSTHLALFHYCLMHGADASRMPLAVARIVDAFLSRDATFKRWRAEHGAALPAAVPRRTPRSRGEHA